VEQAINALAMTVGIVIMMIISVCGRCPIFIHSTPCTHLSVQSRFSWVSIKARTIYNARLSVCEKVPTLDFDMAVDFFFMVRRATEKSRGDVEGGREGAREKEGEGER
jgi:hypothetical protein